MLLALTMLLQEALPAATPAQIVARGREEAALAAKDLEFGRADAALGHARASVALRPMHGGLRLLQAQIEVAAGATEDALATLRPLAAMGFGFELRDEVSLAPLFDHPAFVEIETQLRANREPLVRSEVAFRVERAGFHAEGITHDPQTGDFYLSSFDGGEIVRVSKIDGKWRTELFADLEKEGMKGAYGMALDAKRRRLYVSGGAARGKPSGDQSGILHSLLLSGSKGGMTRHDRPLGTRLLGDVTIVDQNDLLMILASDPISGALYYLSDGGSGLLVPSGELSSPQGMATLLAQSRREPVIVVADYAAGIFLVPRKLPTRPERLRAPADACLLGIDGLARHGNDLIAIQNGIGVYRVLRLRLDEKFEAITEVEVLERAHPLHGEPTLGVVVGNDYYYVANAPWNLPEGEEPPPAVVLRLSLQ